MDGVENWAMAVSFPQWPISQHCKAWRKLYRKRSIANGARIALPNPLQLFEVIGRKFWGHGKERKTSFVFASRCCLCGECYSFNVPERFRSLVRTCPEHRRMKPRADKQSPEAARASYKPETPLRDMILGELAECACVAPTMPLAAFLGHCVDMIEPPAQGQRDTRRQRVKAAIAALDKAGAWPDGARLDGNLLIFTS